MNFHLLNQLIPPGADDNFLLWWIGLLLAGVVTIWRLYVSAMTRMERYQQAQTDKLEGIMNQRVEEAHHMTAQVMAENKELKAEIFRIISEMKPSLDANTATLKSVLDILKHGIRQ